MTTEQKGRCVGDPTEICCNPPVPPIYGTSSAQYPPPLSTPSYPQPIPPQQFQPAPLRQQPYFTVPIGYQSYACPVVVTDGLPVKVVGTREPPLPCCGLGIGWALFIAGFFLPAVPWYVGAIILFVVAIDYREKAGLVACTVMAVLAAVTTILGLSKNNSLWALQKKQKLENYKLFRDSRTEMKQLMRKLQIYTGS